MRPDPYYAIIEKNRIYSENGNKPFAGGILNPDNFSPHPKNPVIARVFKEMGLADTEQVTEQVTEQDGRIKKILDYCKEPKTTAEIMTYIELTHREHFRSEILKPLIESGLLLLTVPDKPNSPKQKYYSKYAEKAK